ncbi:MAG: hypothetical protein JWO27_745 [Frankiales bacterium]|nr:hypothetical protein [Frankiales bacterium]
MVAEEVCPAVPRYGKAIGSWRVRMNDVTFVASLRVYEPLAGFDGAEREHWERYAAEGAHFGTSAGTALERAAALAAVAGRTLPVTGDHAYVTEVDGVTLVCPWRTGLRAQEALLDFCAELPDVLSEAFAPTALLERAEVELDRWRAENGSTTSHIRTCTWQVPLRWFVLVDPEEREVSLGEQGTGPSGPGTLRRTGRQLVYRTPMSRARRRVARALAVVRTAVGDPAVSEGIEDLGRWLEEFHPRSLVELDYGDLVHLLDDAELTQDESARDMQHALQRLADGDGAEAGAAYALMTTRMKALQAVESAN